MTEIDTSGFDTGDDMSMDTGSDGGAETIAEPDTSYDESSATYDDAGAETDAGAVTTYDDAGAVTTYDDILKPSGVELEDLQDACPPDQTVHVTTPSPGAESTIDCVDPPPNAPPAGVTYHEDGSRHLWVGPEALASSEADVSEPVANEPEPVASDPEPVDDPSPSAASEPGPSSPAE